MSQRPTSRGSILDGIVGTVPEPRGSILPTAPTSQTYGVSLAEAASAGASASSIATLGADLTDAASADVSLDAQLSAAFKAAWARSANTIIQRH